MFESSELDGGKSILYEGGITSEFPLPEKYGHLTHCRSECFKSLLINESIANEV